MQTTSISVTLHRLSLIQTRFDVRIPRFHARLDQDQRISTDIPRVDVHLSKDDRSAKKLQLRWCFGMFQAACFGLLRYDCVGAIQYRARFGHVAVFAPRGWAYRRIVRQGLHW